MSRVHSRMDTAINAVLIGLFITAAFAGSALFAWGITRPEHQRTKPCTCVEDR